jgi:hypothetical protein
MDIGENDAGPERNTARKRYAVISERRTRAIAAHAAEFSTGRARSSGMCPGSRGKVEFA